MYPLPLTRPAAAVIASVFACAPAADRAPVTDLVEVDSPAGPMSGEPNLAVDGGGRVYLSWLERTGDSTFALRYATDEADGWSAPVTITERADLFVNWADFPSLTVTPGGRVVAHWLQRSSAGRYNYDVMVRQGDVAGGAWAEPRLLNTDGLAAEHGFVSLFAAEGDSVEAVWLDGRATAGDGRQAGGAMQLGNARIGPDGGVSPNVMIDDRICDCCQTAVAVTSRGPVVVYRDRSPDEVRDIGIVRRFDGRWTEPTLVHADGWRIEACPVNGPGIAASGDHVAVAWFTGARDTARVNVAFSDDAGATFGPPIRVDDGQPAGRVDVELDGAGRAIVTWLERAGDEAAEVRMRAIDPRGSRSAPMVVATSAAARASGFPRLARRGSEIFIAWTLPGDTARVHVARGRLAFPEP